MGVPVPIIAEVALRADGTADVAAVWGGWWGWLEYRMVDGDHANLEVEE